MPAHRRDNPAFTLTEMLVVIGIIMLVATITIPMMAPFFKHQALRAGARTTQAILIHARSAAINERALAGVYLYVLDSPTAPHKGGALVVAYDSDNDPLHTLDTVLGAPAYLPQSISFSIVNDTGGDLMHAGSKAVTITFEPNGLVKPFYANGLNVRVKDFTGEAATITVPGYMGR